MVKRKKISKLVDDIDEDAPIPDDVTDLRRQELEESKRLLKLIKEPPEVRNSPDSAVGRPFSHLVEAIFGEKKIKYKRKEE